HCNVPLRRKTHQTIQRVTDDIEQEFHFNTAISAMMELVNAIYEAVEKEKPESSIIREAVETVVILLHPFVPHISEEMWQRLNVGAHCNVPLLKQPWPKYDPVIAKEEEISLVIQVNGKVRSRLEVSAGLDQEEIKKRVLQDSRVQERLAGNTVKKIIVVPNRLVNIVIE
ncbi:MAG: class I tRNA ligase family protein, partial [Candidatus Omnitrophica bacterium]|nr:class I tRNA ligase family protein [Candidatus Omnitrophota bacterium]